VTQVVATLVDGMQGHANCDDSINVTYLPLSMGYQSCYKRYMALLGYPVRTTEMGAFIETGGDGKEVDAGEYCSFPTYFNLWKHDFPDLKVSWPVEDICKDCFAFANRHRYLANRTMGCNDDDAEGNGNNDDNGKGNDNNNTNGGPMAETARANVAMTDAAMTAATMMAARTFPMLESSQLGT
jgi:hypothetical protein